MSIALSVIETLREELARHPGRRLTKVKLGIGEFSGVEEQSLRFCLDVAFAEEGWAGVEVQMDRELLQAVCGECGFVFHPEESDFLCPRCESGEIEVRTGQSVTIDSMVLE